MCTDFGSTREALVVFVFFLSKANSLTFLDSVILAPHAKTKTLRSEF